MDESCFQKRDFAAEKTYSKNELPAITFFIDNDKKTDEVSF